MTSSSWLKFSRSKVVSLDGESVLETEAINWSNCFWKYFLTPFSIWDLMPWVELKSRFLSSCSPEFFW
jgi:hypothetical protein